MRRFNVILPAVALAATALAGRVEIPAPPASAFADTEAETNREIPAAGAMENKLRLAIELNGGTNNSVHVELGTDSNGNLMLDAEEIDFSLGWDCGYWFYRDRRSGQCQVAAMSPGNRRLDWMVASAPASDDATLNAKDGGTTVFAGRVPKTFFNPGWNLARIVRRGAAAGESCEIRTFADPFRVILR